MAWIAVDKDGTESEWKIKPIRLGDEWFFSGQQEDSEGLKELPKGSIEKLIGRKLTWEDEPVELKEKE